IHPLTSCTNNRYSDNGLFVVKPSYPSIQMFMKQDDQVRGNYGSYLLDDRYRAGVVDTIIWKYVGLECYREGGVSESETATESVTVSSITRRGVNRSLGYGNINICRTAGLWLRAAEAANRVGLSTTAVALMNEVRNRVGVGQSSVKQNASVEDIENALIEERALELAYEGERWYDLVSVAVRRSDPNFLIDRVVAKFPQAEKEAVKARLQFQKDEATGASNNPMYWWKLPRPAVYRNEK
ncbi:MAG: RagB/SusD family nutrient uptake outer membrane protein, partial [Bacteroidales bacterium]|nr:RagB/SusD family nutrient uptake outer membrane protein [Bacteroidales bacterium]